MRSPKLDAEHLLAHVLGCKRLDLYVRFDQPVEPAEVELYRELVRRRGQREPLAYLLGSWGFRGLDLACDARALIPRSETELLVERGLARIAEIATPSVLDLGTGTGAIALAIKHERPEAQVTAVDISPDALALARENAERLQLDVELLEGDLFAPVTGRSFDLVLTNPPYVGTREEVDPELANEPALAIYADSDGLAVIHRIVRDHPGGVLGVEIGSDQGAAVKQLLDAAGFERTGVEQDLNRRDRYVFGLRVSR